MKAAADLVQAIHHIKFAYEFLDSFRRDNKGSRADFLFKTYQNKLEWIVKDFITIPYLPQVVRDGLRKEWESDIFTIDAIMTNISLLTPEQRTIVENIIESILKGEEIKIIEDGK